MRPAERAEAEALVERARANGIPAASCGNYFVLADPDRFGLMAWTIGIDTIDQAATERVAQALNGT